MLFSARPSVSCARQCIHTYPKRQRGVAPKGVGSLFHVGGGRLSYFKRLHADMKKTPDPFRLRSRIRVVLPVTLVLASLLPGILFAQQAQPESSIAARQAYAAAAALQKNELYDTAADEWAAFVKKFP